MSPKLWSYLSSHQWSTFGKAKTQAGKYLFSLYRIVACQSLLLEGILLRDVNLGRTWIVVMKQYKIIQTRMLNLFFLVCPSDTLHRAFVRCSLYYQLISILTGSKYFNPLTLRIIEMMDNLILTLWFAGDVSTLSLLYSEE